MTLTAAFHVQGQHIMNYTMNILSLIINDQLGHCTGSHLSHEHGLIKSVIDHNRVALVCCLLSSGGRPRRKRLRVSNE